MKKYIYKLVVVALITQSCVDDYNDANMAPQLDAPYGFVQETLSEDAYYAFDVEEDDYFNFIKSGSTAQILIEIVDAPGVLDSVAVSLSNIVQVDPLGSASASLEGAAGQQTGTVVVSYTAGEILDLEQMTVTVFDRQDPPKQTSFVIAPFWTVDATACFPTSRDIDEKVYRSTTTMVTDSESDPLDEDYPGEIDRLFHVVEFSINSDIGASHPGFMTISDASFGLFELQGFSALEEVVIEICDGNIVSADGDVAPGFSGTINEDGTINITWTTVYGDAGTTLLTPCADCSLDWSPKVYYME